MSLRVDWVTFACLVVCAGCAFAVSTEGVPRWIAGFPAGLLTLLMFRALWSLRSRPYSRDGEEHVRGDVPDELF